MIMKIMIKETVIYGTVSWEYGVLMNIYSEHYMSIVNYTIISNNDINILYEDTYILGAEVKSGTVFYNSYH